MKLGLKLSEIVNNDGDQSSSVSVFVVPLRHQGVMFMSTFSQVNLNNLYLIFEPI